MARYPWEEEVQAREEPVCKAFALLLYVDDVIEEVSHTNVQGFHVIADGNVSGIYVVQESLNSLFVLY